MTDEQDLLPLANIPPGLKQEEAEYVYNIEVLGLPMKKSAQLAGLPLGSATKPHIMQARELVRTELRGNLQVTKEDATHGIKEAINRAKLLAEPMTEIAGWDRLIKLHGLDSPQRIDVNLNASIEVLQQHVRGMSDVELIKALGAGGVIDAEFYEVKDQAADG